MDDQRRRTELEAARILAENERRRRELPASRYAPSEPGELFLRLDRSRVARRLLARSGKMPSSDSRVLEIGCGSGGWLTELLSWGIAPVHLAGIDLDAARVEVAKEALPGVDLRVGDAAALPWPDGDIDLVVISTVFSSILDHEVRAQVAREVVRVLSPQGAVLWYDLRFNNPNNANVEGISARALARLFPELEVVARPCGLMPPLARWLARRSPSLASLAAALPPLRSHLLAVAYRR